MAILDGNGLRHRHHQFILAQRKPRLQQTDKKTAFREFTLPMKKNKR